MCLKFRLKNCYVGGISNVNVQVIPFSSPLDQKAQL